MSENTSEPVGSGPRYRIYSRMPDDTWQGSGTGGPFDRFDTAMWFVKREENRWPKEIFRITAFKGDVVYETPAAPPASDSGRLPSRFATPANALPELDFNDPAVFDAYIDRYANMSEKLATMQAERDALQIRINQLNSQADNHAFTVAEILTERDAAVADAEALRAALELVLSRRNGHIVGTKHLHEADILQLEKALRAASADAGAKGDE
jgi:hypothetical protein